VAIDNCTPHEDALVDVGQRENVAPARRWRRWPLPWPRGRGGSHPGQEESCRRPSFPRTSRGCPKDTWTGSTRPFRNSITPGPGSDGRRRGNDEEIKVNILSLPSSP
jgi:hypothetical protein